MFNTIPQQLKGVNLSSHPIEVKLPQERRIKVYWIDLSEPELLLLTMTDNNSKQVVIRWMPQQYHNMADG